MQQTSKTAPISRYSQIISPSIFPKWFSKNAVYEPVLFQTEHPRLLDVMTDAPSGWIFSATERKICYLEVTTRRKITLSFHQLGSIISNLKTEAGADSLWVEMFAKDSYHIPDRLYHLAAIITTQYPDVQWNIENQILRFEAKLIKENLLTSKWAIGKKQTHIIKYRQWCTYFQELKQIA